MRSNMKQWLAANMCVSSFAIGLLSIPIFNLGFVDAVLTTFFINFLGTIPVAFFSTFGPRFGMRQVSPFDSHTLSLPIMMPQVSGSSVFEKADHYIQELSDQSSSKLGAVRLVESRVGSPYRVALEFLLFSYLDL